jgi:hypothetical protein
LGLLLLKGTPEDKREALSLPVPIEKYLFFAVNKSLTRFSPQNTLSARGTR